MNVREIVRAELEELGADGLSNPHCVGCELDDLFACDLIGCLDCVPATMHTPRTEEEKEEFGPGLGIMRPMEDEEEE